MLGWIAVFFVLVVTVAIPVGTGVFLALRKKGLFKSFLAGAGTFIVSQLVLRIPLLSLLLPKLDGYNLFVALYPALYALFLGLTAGLFENTGRFLVMRYALPKHRSWADGVAFGLGHGGVEALLLVGLNYLLGAKQILAIAPAGLIAVAGVERMAAIALHVGLSVLVLRGITLHKGWMVWLAIIIHGMVDSCVGLLQLAGVSMWGIEAVVIAAGAGMLAYALFVRPRWREIE